MPAASHPKPSPDRNHAPKRIGSTTPYSQGFRFLYRHRVDVAWGVLGLVQSTRLENVSSLLQLPQVQPQPCLPLPLLSSSAGVRTPFPLPLRTVLYHCAVPDPRVCRIFGDVTKYFQLYIYICIRVHMSSVVDVVQNGTIRLQSNILYCTVLYFTY